MKNQGPYICLVLYWEAVTGTQAVFPDPRARNTQATIASLLIPLPWPGYPALFGYLYMVFLPSDGRTLSMIPFTRSSESVIRRREEGYGSAFKYCTYFAFLWAPIPAPLDHP